MRKSRAAAGKTMLTNPVLQVQNPGLRPAAVSQLRRGRTNYPPYRDSNEVRIHKL